MSVMKMYVEEYLNAEQVAENFYIIHLSNGKEIEVTERPVHNGNVWDWKVDSQVFDTDNYALNYLKKLVAEKLTGSGFSCTRNGKSLIFADMPAVFLANVTALYVVTVPLRRRSLQNAMAWNLFMRYEIENI